jgi:hypothetical protein
MPVTARTSLTMALVTIFFACTPPLILRAQSTNASLKGTVQDPTGAVIPGADLALKSMATGLTAKFTTGQDGTYHFGNLSQGSYELTASAKGFKDLVRTGITVNLNESVRLDVGMEVGNASQTVEVAENASPLNFETGEVKGALSPESIAELPLIVSGNQRAAAAFIILLPGISTGGAANPFDARINGGLMSGDEAVLDGITMQQGTMSQSGMISIFNDYPISPDSVKEVSLLTSNYEPQYGSTTSGVVTAVSKSGTNEFHGNAHELLRNKVLNARSFGVPNRPTDTENDWGATIGGPAKIPGLWSGSHKTYFFLAYGGFRIRGGTVSSILSIPSLKERQGDFTDWRDAKGNLIPIFDPATTRTNPNYSPKLPVGPGNQPFLRDQFMGCDGRTPNVICPSDPRLQNSLAKQWFQFLPNPTFDGPLNNLVGLPLASGSLRPTTNRVSYDARIDEYVGTKEHISVELHYHAPHYFASTSLTPELATEAETVDGGFVGPWVNRLNWDHTFTPTLLNNVNYGYLNFRGRSKCLDDPYVDKLPKIPGVADHAEPPTVSFQDFTSFGCNAIVRDSRPTNVVNDLMTWVKGKHTVKFGGEYRRLQLNLLNHVGGSGAFTFSRLNTGLAGVQSGNSVASFLLEQVNTGSAAFYTVDLPASRADALNLHVGDTWRIRPKLSINYGLRWDLNRPTVEKFDRLSFFDPAGPNPGAGERPGRLTFAGDRWGAASYGERHPEQTFHKAFAPRLGMAYSLTPKTVIRSGYGIFFTQAYYPGWGGGIALDGFNANPTFTSSNGGITPAFILSQGLPQNFTRPPFIDPSFLNGQNAPLYRPADANRLSYAQQWNLTLEHQFTNNFYVTAAYVGNKGTRLPSDQLPLNVLNPSLLSMGPALFDQFQPGQTVLDGVPVPYSNWVQQMSSCPPTVAQALLPYPQYCGSLTGLNENAGSSTYHALQLKAEKRFSDGVWLLASYTFSKTLSSSDFVNPSALTWAGASGVISPFERQRNKALSVDDVPHLFSLALIYDLPFGRGKHFLNRGGVLNKIVGGWQTTHIFRASAGVPFLFRSSVCNVPAQFRVGCIPGVLPGADPWAIGEGQFSPDKPVFNASAFEPVSSFNFYYGKGSRVTNLRGPGYHNQDFGLMKNTYITERVGLQIRGEIFNVWNWHIFNCIDQCFGSTAFNTDISSPNFGMWNGSVTAPRNVQLGMQVIF